MSRYFFVVMMWLGAACSSYGALVQIEQDDTATVNLLQQQSPFTVADVTPKLYVSAGIGRNLTVRVLDGETVVQVLSYSNVAFDDTFQIESVTHQGKVFTIDPIEPGAYTIEVTVRNEQIPISTNQYQLIVDTTPPEIVGEFQFDSVGPGSYYDTHTDNTLIISRHPIRWMGYSSYNSGQAGVSHATFSSSYLDGPLVGEFHAQEESVIISNTNRLMVGNGVRRSVSSAYIPINTTAKMLFTYTLYGVNGLTASRNVELYVDTFRSNVAPEPYGVYTGVNEALDNVQAFNGFESYVPNMLVNTNPIRMIYRAPRDSYFGGGGDAQIYGNWLKYTGFHQRNADMLVHSDEEFLYFDVTATTNGSQFDNSAIFVAEYTRWRSMSLVHELTLTEDALPPVPTSLSFMREGSGEWESSVGNTVRMEINKEDTDYQNDSISQARITVESRPYAQQFDFSFIVDEARVSQNCVILAGQTECIIATDLPFPGDDVNVYHNRHRIMDLEHGRMSEEIVSLLEYDGAPAEYDEDQTTIDSDRREAFLVFTKTHARRVWGLFKILDVRPFAVLNSDIEGDSSSYIATEEERVYLDTIEHTQLQENEINVHRGTYDYSVVGEGEYVLYAQVEDGKDANFKHTNIHYIDTLSIPDTTPPVISFNFSNGDTVETLLALEVTLSDVSNARVTELNLLGGPNDINMALPMIQVNEETIRAEHVHVALSQGSNYILSVTAVDDFGNESRKTAEFDYMTRTVAMPVTTLPAIASPLRSLDGKPFNVILTPQIKSVVNQVARGVHTVYFTLSEDAPSAFVINGQQVSPGGTVEIEQNLSLTNHKLRIEAYPFETGAELAANFSLHIPQIRVSVCPRGFVQASARCLLIDVKQANYECPSPFSLTEDSQCQMAFSYPATAQCADAYTQDDLTCSKDIELSMVTTCPPAYGLMADGVTCAQHRTVDVEPCRAGSTFVDGMCQRGNDFLPTGLYCNENDVSGGEVCQNGSCYNYVGEWNACDVVSTLPAVQSCTEGFELDGICIMNHTYDLAAECEFGYTREGFNCSRLVIEPAIKTCSEPFVLSQDQSYCSHMVFEPFVECPPTHRLVDGRCHEVADIDISCPDTHTWNGSTCEQLITYPANETCPNEPNWSDSGSECVYFDSMDAEACDVGFFHSNGDCFEIVSSEQVCPLNYVNDGSGVCEYRDSLSISSCPDNYNLIDGKCFEVVDANENCLSPDFTIVDGNCQRVDIQPISSCPAGSVLENGACFDVEEAVQVCPPGYSNNGSTCDLISAEPISSCPPNYLFSNGQCFEIVDASQVCSSGYVNDGQGQCVQDVSTNVSSCPSSHVLINGSCHLKQNAQESCPVGYSNDGDGTCSRFESEDPVSCPSGFLLQSGNCHVVNEAAQNCRSGFLNDGDGTCSQFQTTDVTSCPSGYLEESGSCYGISDALESCPDGFSLVNGQCEETTSVSPAVNCPQGFSVYETDQCRSAVSFTYTCPPDYTNNLVPVGTCSRMVRETQFFFLQSKTCDAGWNTLSFEPAFNGYYQLECERWVEDQIAASKTCPIGYDLSDISIGAFQPSIPGGSIGLLDAKAQSSGSICESIVPADLTCEDGFSLSQGMCSRTQVLPIDYSCNAGSSIYQTNRCKNNSASNSVGSCPSGYTLNSSNGDCERTRHDTVNYNCSVGFSNYDTDRCLSSIPTFSVGNCPSGGYTLNTSNGDCERTLHDIVGFNCPAGFVSNGPEQCRAVAPDLAVGSCPAGHTLNTNNGNCEQTLVESVSYECTSGFSSYQSDRCLANSANLSVGICLPGSNLDSSTGICMRISNQPIDYQCPVDYTNYQTSQCKANTATLTVGNCPALYTLDPIDGACKQTLIESINYSCNDGYSEYALTFCQNNSPTPTVGTCQDPGYTLNPITGMCDIYLFEPVDYQCPDSYSAHLNDACRADSPSFDRGICTAPFSLNSTNGDCEEIDTLAYTYICDPAPLDEPVTLNVDSCFYYDLAGETRTCEPSFSPISPDVCQHDTPADNVGICNDTFDVTATNCQREDSTAYTYYCENPEHTLEDAQCSQLLEALVTVTCQSGEELVDGQCLRTEQLDETRYCDDPYSMKGISECERRVEINSF